MGGRPRTRGRRTDRLGRTTDPGRSRRRRRDGVGGRAGGAGRGREGAGRKGGRGGRAGAALAFAAVAAASGLQGQCSGAGRAPSRCAAPSLCAPARVLEESGPPAILLAPRGSRPSSGARSSSVSQRAGRAVISALEPLPCPGVLESLGGEDRRGHSQDLGEVPLVSSYPPLEVRVLAEELPFCLGFGTGACTWSHARQQQQVRGYHPYLPLTGGEAESQRGQATCLGSQRRQSQDLHPG